MFVPAPRIARFVALFFLAQLFWACGGGGDKDTTAPVVTLNGAQQVTVREGDSFSDPGATASDDRDSSVSVITSGDVDTDTAGTYTLTYTATDRAGNSASATRSVTVIATFITTWQTDIPGATEDNQIKISTLGTGYNYTVDWGDGNVDTGITGDITHTYDVSGTYTVAIMGAFPRIYFDYEGSVEEYDNEKLLTIEQWGDNQWQSMEKAFLGCINLTMTAIDMPNLGQVTDMSSMFAGAEIFNGEIGDWDVSSVTNMSAMFADAAAFNQGITSWDVSSVTDMSEMFEYALEFNQDIGAWDVSSVTDTSEMFDYAVAFNQNIAAWDVSSVTDMSYMFSNATAFNQNIGAWNVSSVETMNRMFWNASSFNQDIGAWNIVSAFYLTDMFLDAGLSTQNYDALLNGWSARSLRNEVNFNGGNSTYSTAAEDARSILINTYGWTVTDGGLEN